MQDKTKTEHPLEGRKRLRWSPIKKVQKMIAIYRADRCHHCRVEFV